MSDVLVICLSQISTYYIFAISVILTLEFINEPREIQNCFWSFRCPQQWHCTSEGSGNEKDLLKEKFLEKANCKYHNSW